MNTHATNQQLKVDLNALYMNLFRICMIYIVCTYKLPHAVLGNLTTCLIMKCPHPHNVGVYSPETHPHIPQAVSSHPCSWHTQPRELWGKVTQQDHTIQCTCIVHVVWDSSCTKHTCSTTVKYMNKHRSTCDNPHYTLLYLHCTMVPCTL